MCRATIRVAAFAGILVFASTTIADEQSVPLGDLPRKISEAVKARFPRAELVKASKEKENGEMLFEVAIKLKGQSMDVTVKEDGSVVEIEKVIDVEDLPTPVSKALQAKYPNSRCKLAEEVIKQEKLEYFEVVLVTADNKKLEVCVAPNGKITKEEKKDDDKD